MAAKPSRREGVRTEEGCAARAAGSPVKQLDGMNDRNDRPGSDLHHAADVSGTDNLRLCGNPLLANLVLDFYGYMMGYRRQAMSKPGAIRQSHPEHCDIVAALRTHDPAAVQSAFARHLDRVYASTKSVLKEDGNAGD